MNVCCLIKDDPGNLLITHTTSSMKSSLASRVRNINISSSRDQIHGYSCLVANNCSDINSSTWHIISTIIQPVQRGFQLVPKSYIQERFVLLDQKSEGVVVVWLSNSIIKLLEEVLLSQFIFKYERHCGVLPPTVPIILTSKTIQPVCPCLLFVCTESGYSMFVELMGVGWL